VRNQLKYGMPSNSINKMSRILHFCFCALCVIVLSGCVTTEETGRMQWEINELKSDVKKIKKASETPVGKKLKELENSQKATASTVSDLLIQMQNLTTEFQVLTGRFEEARYQSEKTLIDQESEKETLLARITELEESLAKLKKTPPAKKAVPVIPAVKKEAPKPEIKKADSDKPDKKKDLPSDKASIKDLYLAAYQDFKEGKTADAREKFTSLLETYPENEYSDNARFWIGESYYKDESYEDAILAYEELFRKNPKSDKKPGAMLKQGLAFYAINDKETGTLILEKLIKHYPDSEQARLAKRKITKSVPPKKKK
jgi:tol-pal system protein YbgF